MQLLSFVKMRAIKFLIFNLPDEGGVKRGVIFITFFYFLSALVGYFFRGVGWSSVLPVLYFGYPILWIFWFICFLEDCRGSLEKILRATFLWALLDVSFLLLICATAMPGVGVGSPGVDALFLLGYGIFMFPLLCLPGVDGVIDRVAAWFGSGNFLGAWIAFSLLGLVQTALALGLRRLFSFLNRARSLKD